MATPVYTFVSVFLFNSQFIIFYINVFYSVQEEWRQEYLVK